MNKKLEQKKKKKNITSWGKKIKKRYDTRRLDFYNK